MRQSFVVFVVVIFLLSMLLFFFGGELVVFGVEFKREGGNYIFLFCLFFVYFVCVCGSVIAIAVTRSLTHSLKCAIIKCGI